jgi:hypothetical protein
VHRHRRRARELRRGIFRGEDCSSGRRSPRSRTDGRTPPPPPPCSRRSASCVPQQRADTASCPSVRGSSLVPLAAIRQAIAKSVVAYYQKCACLSAAECTHTRTQRRRLQQSGAGSVPPRHSRAASVLASLPRSWRSALTLRAASNLSLLSRVQTLTRPRRRRSRRSSPRTTAACSLPTRAAASRRNSVDRVPARAARSRTVRSVRGGNHQQAIGCVRRQVVRRLLYSWRRRARGCGAGCWPQARRSHRQAMF